MNWSIIKLIIEREFFTRVRKKSFVVMTLLAPFLIAALMIFSVWLSVRDNQTQKIIVVDDNYPSFSILKNQPGIQFEVMDITLIQAQTLLHESDFTAVLYLPKNIVASNVGKLFVKSMPSALTQRKIEKQVEGIIEHQKLLINKIDPAVYAKIDTEFNLSPYKIGKPGDEKKVNSDQAYIGFVFGIFIYVFIIMYCSQVMRGVIEEKVNRIVEVIVSSVKPFELMLGKILGIALVGLTQFVLWGLLTLVVFMAAKGLFFQDYYNPETIQQLQMSGDIAKQFQDESLTSVNIYDPNNIINRINFPVMLSLFLFYFIGGYLFYSALFAAVGSIIDNEADTQQFMVPLTLPLLLAYIISASVIKNPDGAMAVWFSIIPFTSPVVMMVRAAVGVGGGGGIPIWQVGLSMLALVIGFIVTTYIAAKIYRTGILMYGKKASFKEVIKWIGYKN